MEVKTRLIIMNNFKYLNSVLINLIVASIIPFLIWGPFFPDLIVSFSALFILFHVFKNKKFYLFNNYPLIIFFIFCIYCILLSVFIAKETMISFGSSLFYFRIGVFSCFIWYLIEQDKKILQYFYFILIFSFLALILDGYFQYFTGYNILGLKASGLRVSSFFGDEQIMGSYLSRLYPLAFAFLFLRNDNKLKLSLVITLFILTSGLIYISGERTAFFFHLLSLTFIVLLVKKLKFVRFFFLASVIGVVAILSLSNNSLKNRMFNSPIESMGINKESKYIFTIQHESLIRTAYNMFLDKPIFGHGPKMYRVICKNEKYAAGINPCMTHPHNFYVQLLAETGIIGFMFLLSIFFLCNVLYGKTIKNNYT